MAVVDKKQTIPVLTTGVNMADPTNNVGWVQNLNHYQHAWETRDGFGVLGIYDTQMLVKAPVPETDSSKGPKDLGFKIGRAHV